MPGVSGLLSCPTGRQVALWIYREPVAWGTLTSFWAPTYALGRSCGLWQVRLWVALACWSALDGKGRVRVLLNIMGGQMPLMIDRADLAAA